jgi:hypothetical protein
MIAAPPLREPIADQRLGSSIRLITLNGVDTRFAPLSFLVFREPRPTSGPGPVGLASEAALHGLPGRLTSFLAL